MQILLFTKIFPGASVREVGEAALQMGVDGLDLAVRKGQCIEPATAAETLPDAIKTWKTMGLGVPMLTLEGDFIDPARNEVKTIFETCARCEIPFVKLGYWKWQPGQNYQEGVEKIRRALEEFQKLGQEYAVCSLMHTHSGLFYGSNATGARQLVDGFDPRFIGAYLDPAHQALQGEPPALALAITGEYLKMVGVKNARYVSAEGGVARRSEWCPLEEGLVDWHEVITLLQQCGYDGPLSFHAERQNTADVAVHDVKLLRSWL